MSEDHKKQPLQQLRKIVKTQQVFLDVDTTTITITHLEKTKALKKVLVK